jgi:hypothetical protein
MDVFWSLIDCVDMDIIYNLPWLVTFVRSNVKFKVDITRVEGENLRRRRDEDEDEDDGRSSSCPCHRGKPQTRPLERVSEDQLRRVSKHSRGIHV